MPGTPKIVQVDFDACCGASILPHSQYLSTVARCRPVIARARCRVIARIFDACPGQTPLHLLARHNRIEVLHVLLEHGANVAAEDNQCRTPLHVASSSNNRTVEVARVLLEHGANVDAKDHLDRTPF
jgi:hypothetical protein